MKRREFLRLASLSPLALLALRSGVARASNAARRVIVLGIDGMDPVLLRKFASEGRMPNAARLMRMGGMSSLGTSNPPQSPVAWSGFITGAGPDVHGIYDFIHRDAATMSPFLSTSEVTDSPDSVGIGKWRIPTGGAEVRLLRRGRPFWRHITDDGIPASLVKLPVDFPPPRGRARILSGLGTPDLRGSQGSFTFFTDDPRALSDDTGGGIIRAVRDYGDGLYECRLEGPENTMLENGGKMEVPLNVWIDRDSRGVRVDVCGESIVLGEGEWSPWVSISFDLIPGISSVDGIARFFLKEAGRYLKLYVTPINIDPRNPALPISSPGHLSADLARAVGPFYTQGFPEDTKALSRGVLGDAEYMQQAEIVLAERMKLYEHSLSGFDEGLFFFYFTSLDLNVHMFYRALDPYSPLHPEVDMSSFGDVVADLYGRIDRAIGMAMDHMDGRTVLLALSDHGFAPFRRAFNLNSWLAAEGYATLGDPYSRDQDMYAAADWSSTSAYGLGLNGLYINLRGREKDGVVPPAEKEALSEELAARLEAVTDPATGRRVVRRAYLTDRVFGPDQPPWAPDIIVGYANGYRASWETTLGSYPREVITDNLDPWSGTHCTSPAVVPGTLLSSVPLALSDPTLMDMGSSICGLMGTSTRPAHGRNVFSEEGETGS
jgi:predicted AlkP superfamily phosphohydrolase/phosphomutase